MSKLRLGENSGPPAHSSCPGVASDIAGAQCATLLFTSSVARGLADRPCSPVVCVAVSAWEATGLARLEPCSVDEQQRRQLGASEKCRVSAPTQSFRIRLSSFTLFPWRITGTPELVMEGIQGEGLHPARLVSGRGHCVPLRGPKRALTAAAATPLCPSSAWRKACQSPTRLPSPESGSSGPIAPGSPHA